MPTPALSRPMASLSPRDTLAPQASTACLGPLCPPPAPTAPSQLCCGPLTTPPAAPALLATRASTASPSQSHAPRAITARARGRRGRARHTQCSQRWQPHPSATACPCRLGHSSTLAQCSTHRCTRALPQHTALPARARPCRAPLAGTVTLLAQAAQRRAHSARAAASVSLAPCARRSPQQATMPRQAQVTSP